MENENTLPQPEYHEIELQREELSTLPSEPIDDKPNSRQLIEALLFSTDQPISTAKIKNLLEEVAPESASLESIKSSLDELRAIYTERESAFELVELGGGYILQTKEDFFPILEAFYQKQTPQRISRAAYEVLAIVAYRQPITRAEIDVIRGVDSTGPLSYLIEKELVKMTGRKEVPGHPPLYGTTKEFLELCGLGSIKELPELKELKKPKPRKKIVKTEKKEPKKTPDKPQEINLTLPQ